MSHFTSNLDGATIWSQLDTPDLPLAEAIEQLPTGAVIINSRGYLELANQKARELLAGYQGEFVDARWIEVVAKAFIPHCADGADVRTTEGRTVSIDTKPLPGTGQLLVLHDVSETRALQKQVAHQERLSAMGKMAASLAHQIRTPLSTATLYAANMSQNDLTAEQTKKFSLRIHEQLQKLEQQIADMLVFARGEVIKDRVLSSAELLERVKAEIQHHDAMRVHVTYLNKAPDAHVHVAESTLVGAIVNLVNNAIEASRNEVNIDIFIENERDHQLAINVRDNGPGLSAAALQRAKEAFFTTKSQGTGLGLAVVDAVAMAHQGQFVMSSVPGRGCLASIRIPVVKGGVI